ncbi:HD-GYP domain-containing protein [Marinomonas ostreistagni]|uniref:HD-GYP domain-containing protein n=1 Tax=Marinomonas ostreistagni TaxID=359209 RepID=A0ABS0ZG29_9GAMM|nr:HD-GYP domain-containing protein [Marinomonas ostreistagni]MBJ7551856.1 HD-GYP domain-containing protein [Marinomonas ostreistagni]
MYFARQAFLRIIVASLIISLGAGLVAWFIAVEGAEKEAVDLAMEVSRNTVKQSGLIEAVGEEQLQKAHQVTQSLSTGLFDIAELYNKDARKISESLTKAGAVIETKLPGHVDPHYIKSSYQSLTLDNGDWLLRTFVPIMDGDNIWGYFEGVRLVPEWQRSSIREFSLLGALIAVGAVWLCAAVIYPIILFLNKEQVRQANAITQGNVDMMLTLGKTITLRDCDTGAHNYRVTLLATEIAEAIGFRKEDMKGLILGSYLHDIGKIAISDTILLKPGKLDDQEMSIMKTHVQEGCAMVDGIEWLKDAKDIIEGHHEKWDGSGYPNGLRAKNIPENARIFAIADVFDALCSERPYKPPFSYEKAISIIKEGKGNHFDPDLVDIFVNISKPLHTKIFNLDEDGCRELMLDKMRKHSFF